MRVLVPEGAFLLSPEERTARARIAALALHATHDPHDTTAAARAALWERYRQQADPDNLLDAEERDRRARYLMRADLERRRLAALRARREQADEELVGELVGVAG